METHTHEEVHAHDTAHPDSKSKIRLIWMTALYLGLITAAEFLIAFTMPAGGFRTLIFVIMTFAKVYFIVGEFMHLRYEVKTLIWSIIIPTVFIVWLIGALLREGSTIGEGDNIKQTDGVQK